MEPPFIGAVVEPVPLGSMDGAFVGPRGNGDTGVWISLFKASKKEEPLFEGKYS